MDYFESIIKTLLEAEGYWVQQSFKVNLSKEEKQRIGKPSMPRPEIDLIAYKASANKVMVIEAKSFLDSPGVRFAELDESHDEPEGRYKMFTSDLYRSVVLSRLKEDLITLGMADQETRFELRLVAGNVYQGQSEAVRELLKKKDCFFWSPEEIKQKVLDLAARGYENDPVVITAKILAR